MKIGLVWFVSLLVTSPLIVIGFVHPEEIMSDDDLQCSITNRPFLVYGSVAAYFFPLAVMLVAYTASIRLLGRQGAWSRLRPGSVTGDGRGDAVPAATDGDGSAGVWVAPILAFDAILSVTSDTAAGPTMASTQSGVHCTHAMTCEPFPADLSSWRFDCSSS